MRLNLTSVGSVSNSGGGVPLESQQASQPASSFGPDTSSESSLPHLGHAEDRELPKPNPAANRLWMNQEHPHAHTIGLMHSMLIILDLEKHDDSLMLMMQMKRWDQWLVEWIEHPFVSTPQEAMCLLLQQIFNTLRLPLTPISLARTAEHNR